MTQKLNISAWCV